MHLSKVGMPLTLFFSISVHRQGIQISMWKEGMKIEVKHVKR